jgi:uncharacterized membrane protein
VNPTSQPAQERLAASVLAAIALGLALWLALLKWRSLPCLGGGCDQVIQSRYGSWFGVPVGVFGAGLWIALALPLSLNLRRAIHATLALGAIGFMIVQFGVLRAFCPYCTAHAVAAVTAWRWRRVRVAWWAIGLGAALAVGGYLLAQRAADRRATTASRPETLAGSPSALLPFDDGPLAAGRDRPVLVLSVTCPACLDLLRDLLEASWPQGKTGAALFVKTEARDRALATVWLAACTESAGTSPRDRWVAVTAMLVAQRELVASDPDAAATWLAGVFQPSSAARETAARLLVEHAAILDRAGVIGTPWFLPPGGVARTRVAPGELWP